MTLEVARDMEPDERAVEPQTFDAYVRERSVALQRFAYLVTRHPEDARDAVQDALVGLFPRYAQVAAAGSVDAYVHRSIANAAVSRWRKGGRLVPVAEPEDVRADGRPLEEAVTDAEVAWDLIGELPPAQRTAVVLRYWSDATFADIGAALGCPEATARSHVHRALARLRAHLGEDDHA